MVSFRMRRDKLTRVTKDCFQLNELVLFKRIRLYLLDRSLRNESIPGMNLPKVFILPVDCIRINAIV